MKILKKGNKKLAKQLKNQQKITEEQTRLRDDFSNYVGYFECDKCKTKFSATKDEYGYCTNNDLKYRFFLRCLLCESVNWGNISAFKFVEKKCSKTNYVSIIIVIFAICFIFGLIKYLCF